MLDDLAYLQYKFSYFYSCNIVFVFLRLFDSPWCPPRDSVPSLWSVDSGHQQEWGRLAENGAI